MVLDDRAQRNRMPDRRRQPRDEFEMLRACLADMRSTLATMNEAMDRIEQAQKGGDDASGLQGNP